MFSGYIYIYISQIQIKTLSNEDFVSDFKTTDFSYAVPVKGCFWISFVRTQKIIPL